MKSRKVNLSTSLPTRGDVITPPNQIMISSTTLQVYSPKSRAGTAPQALTSANWTPPLMPIVQPGRPMSREAKLHKLKRSGSDDSAGKTHYSAVSPCRRHTQLPRLLLDDEPAKGVYTGMVRIRFGFFDSELMVVSGRINYDDCLQLWGGIIAAEFRQSSDMWPFLVTPAGEFILEKDGTFEGIVEGGEHTLALRDNARDEAFIGSRNPLPLACVSLDATSITAGIFTTASDDATNTVIMEAATTVDFRALPVDEVDDASKNSKRVNSQGTGTLSQMVSIALPLMNTDFSASSSQTSELAGNGEEVIGTGGSQREVNRESDGGCAAPIGDAGQGDNNFDGEVLEVLSNAKKTPLRAAMLMMPPMIPDLESIPYQAERGLGNGIIATLILNSDTSRRKLVFVRQPTSTRQLSELSTKALDLDGRGLKGVKFLDGVTGEVLEPGSSLQRGIEIYVCVHAEEVFSRTPPKDRFWKCPPPPEEIEDDQELFVSGPLRILRDYLLDYIKPMVKRDRTKINWDAANNCAWRGLTIDKDLGVIRKWVLPCVNLDLDLDVMKPLLGDHLDTLYLAGNVNLTGDLEILGSQCPKLRILNISNTAIEGDIECVRHLTKLAKLDLSGCTHIKGMLPMPLARLPGLEYHLRNSCVVARATAAEQREWLFDTVKLKIEALLYWKQFAQYLLPGGKGSQFMEYGNVNWEIESFGQWYGITFLAGSDRSVAAGVEKVDRPGFYIPDEHFAGQRDNKADKVSEYEHGDALGSGLVSKIWLPNVGLRAEIGPDFRPLYTEHLIVLNLERNPNTTGDIIAIGERCPRIRVLRLGRTLCHGDIASLAGCSSLVELHLEKCTDIGGVMPISLLRIENLACNVEGTSITANEAADLHRGMFKFTVIGTDELLDMNCFESFEVASPRLRQVIETYKECQHWRFSRILSTKKKVWNGNLVEDKFTRDDIAFVSHRWLRPDHPDDAEASKLRHLQMLARQHPEIKAWWVDFMCVPQNMDDDSVAAKHRLAVVSVAHYINCCGTFFVLVNNEHANPRYHFDGPEGWQGGSWPRLERLAACTRLQQRDSNRGDIPLRTRMVVSHAKGAVFRHHVGSASTNGVVEEPLDLRTDPASLDPAKGKFSDDDDATKPWDQKDRHLTRGLRSVLLEMMKRDFAAQDRNAQARRVRIAGFVAQDVQGASTEERVTGGHYDSDEEDGGIAPFELREKPDYPPWYEEILVGGYEKAERWEVRTFDRE